MSRLVELGFCVGRNTAVEEKFTNAIGDFERTVYSTPFDYYNQCLNAYNSLGETNNNLNGSIFELIISTLLFRERITPFYIQGKVSFVPNVNFDILFFDSKIGPVSLSLKTSLRERYKQADLEAMALKNVHRASISYLLTYSSLEAISVKRKIENKDILGLNSIIDCSIEDEFNSFIETLKQFNFIESPTVSAIYSQRIIK